MTKKHYSLGFAPILSLVVVFFLALALGGAVLVANKNTGFTNFASEDSAAGEESDLGLTVLPTLNPSLGKIDLVVKWNPKLKDNDKLDLFRVTVREMPIQYVDNNLISDQILSTRETNQKTFTGLPVKSGKEYYVQLRAIYKEDGEKIKIKVQRVKVGYFEDQFNTLNTEVWKRTNVAISNGTIQVGKGKYTGWLSLHSNKFNILAQKPMHVKVTLTNVVTEGIPNIDGGPSLLWDLDSDHYIKQTANLEYLILSHKIKSQIGNKISSESFDLPLELSMQSDGTNLKLYGAGVSLFEYPIQPFPNGTIGFSLQNRNVGTSLTSNFDNFRLVWVE